MSYQKLETHFAEINDLAHASAIVGWDEAAMMPAGGGEARASAMATLDVISHQKKTDPRILEWISSAQEEVLGEWQKVNVQQIERDYHQANALPEDLVRDLSQSRSRCEQAWRVSRVENDWSSLLPLLTEVVELTREDVRIWNVDDESVLRATVRIELGHAPVPARPSACDSSRWTRLRSVPDPVGI